MTSKEKLSKAIETYMSLRDNGIVKEYYEALHIVLSPKEYDDDFEQKEEIIKEVVGYKLILCLPYKSINYSTGEIVQHSFDGKIKYEMVGV